MAKLLLLDGQPEEINAVIISWGTIVDENNRVVCGANSQADADAIIRRLKALYPDHSFSLTHS